MFAEREVRAILGEVDGVSELTNSQEPYADFLVPVPFQAGLRIWPTSSGIGRDDKYGQCDYMG